MPPSSQPSEVGTAVHKTASFRLSFNTNPLNKASVLTRGSGFSQTNQSFDVEDRANELIEIVEDEESSVDLKKY